MGFLEEFTKGFKWHYFKAKLLSNVGGKLDNASLDICFSFHH